MWLLRQISLPHFTHHAARTALTLIGIAVGVAAMVATVSITDAVFRSFRRTLEATAGGSPLLISNGTIGVPVNLKETATTVPGVATASALVEGFVQLSSSDGEMLAIFGIDLLEDQIHESQLPRASVELPDTLAFVNQKDSVALSRTFASARGLSLGDSFAVLTPTGARTLIVRGLIDNVGPAALYGGVVGLMDLEAAQQLLAKEGRVDRIDIALQPGAVTAEVMRALQATVGAAGRIEERSAFGARAEDLLFSVRVVLTLAGLIAGIVGFFIIYHTVTVSVVQRRREIALLTALGVSRRSVLSWLALESTILGLLAAGIGLVIGHLLARWSMTTFGAVTTAWIRLPTEPAALTLSTVAVAAGTGLITTLLATLLPAAGVVWRPLSPLLNLTTTYRAGNLRNCLIGGCAGLVVVGGLLAFAPRTLPYLPLVAYVFGVNCVALVAFALLSPVVAFLLARTLQRFSARGSGISLLLASAAVVRNPAAAVAVVAAIVVGFGWILADTALITSFKRAWLEWLDEHYQSDLVVSAGGMTVSLLTYPPVSEEVVQAIREMDGVRDVQGVRTVETTYGGRPIVIQAMDESSRGLPLLDASWPDVTDAFRSGGILLTENFAHRTGLRRGSPLVLTTASGPRSFGVLGTFADFQGAGDLGGIAVHRDVYRELWKDLLVSRIRVWLDEGANVEQVRHAIQKRFAATHGLHAITFAEARGAVVQLIDGVFSITYAVILIALVVSFIGVTNFLLTAVLDRRSELRILDAVGVSATQIAKTVMLEGWLLGLVGVGVGFVAGYLVSRIIVEHSVPMVNGWHFAFEFPTTTAVALSASALVLAATAGLLPARLATRRELQTDRVD